MIGEEEKTQIAPAISDLSIRLWPGTKRIDSEGAGVFIMKEALIAGRNVYQEGMIDVPAQAQNNVLLKVP